MAGMNDDVTDLARESACLEDASSAGAVGVWDGIWPLMSSPAIR
jgi:hypothetical protein